MKSQVLHTVWCNISGEASEEIWHQSLLEVKGLNADKKISVFENTRVRVDKASEDWYTMIHVLLFRCNIPASAFVYSRWQLLVVEFWPSWKFNLSSNIEQISKQASYLEWQSAYPACRACFNLVPRLFHLTAPAHSSVCRTGAMEEDGR